MTAAIRTIHLTHDNWSDYLGNTYAESSVKGTRRMDRRRHARHTGLVRLRHERRERHRRDGRDSGRGLAAGVRAGAGRRDAEGQ